MACNKLFNVIIAPGYSRIFSINLNSHMTHRWNDVMSYFHTQYVMPIFSLCILIHEFEYIKVAWYLKSFNLYLKVKHWDVFIFLFHFLNSIFYIKYFEFCSKFKYINFNEILNKVNLVSLFSAKINICRKNKIIMHRNVS